MVSVYEVPESAAAGRVPPHNLEAEESLLGAMMLSRDALTAAVEARIEGRDFYKPTHGHVFDAAWHLHSQGDPVDPVSVSEELRRRGFLEAVGGRSELLRIQAATPASANAAHYAQIVGELALLRRLIGVAGDIAELGYQPGGAVADTLDRAEQMIFEVAEKRVADSMVSLYPALEATMDQLETLYNRDATVVGVPTGFLDLDDLLLGLQPSQLVVVAARPGQGKCVAHDSLLVDPETGTRRTAAETHAQAMAGRPVEVMALDRDQVVRTAAPSAFVDDGVRPVVRVRTVLGREVRTTECHPFLTPTGWKRADELSVGSVVAVPRHIPVEGTEEPCDATVVVLAYVSSFGSRGGEPMTIRSPRVADDFARHASEFKLELYEIEPSKFRLTGRGGRTRRLDAVCDRALFSDESRVPASVERFTNERLALFLNRFLVRGADLWIDASGRARARFQLGSVECARSVSHLLLRFGVVVRRQGFTLEVADELSIERFCEAVGLFGSEAAAARVGAIARARMRKPALTAAGGGPAPEPPLSSVWWDEIAAIEPHGETQVYDLTIPELHNFVADDVFVHNTSFALGAAAHVAITAHKPVIFFSMEMGHLELTKRLLAAEARIDARNLTTGNLTEAEWPKVTQAVGRLAEAPFFIDDNPHCTVMEMRAKARRVKARHGDLAMIVVDYLQLMSSPRMSESRQVEVAEMSRGLKILARELDVPVVCLSQLNRQLEYRNDKRPMLADLRESGCLPAAAQVTLADGSTETLGELYRRERRDVCVLTVDEHYRLVPATMSHVFSTGTKLVYEARLASGRAIRATANHPLLTVEGWVQLGDLRRGDCVAVPRREADRLGMIPSLVWDYLEHKGFSIDGLRAHDLINRLAVPGRTAATYRDGISRSLMSRIARQVGDSFLEDLARSHVHWDRVERITALGEEEVFDATVPGTHNFVADDVVVHNSIEQDADIVLFIYRDEYYNPESDQRGVAEIIVAKHRNGPTGSTRLAFLDQYTKFANMARE